MRKFALVLLLGLLGPLFADPFGRPKVTDKDERREFEFADGTILRSGQNAKLQFVLGSREVILEKGAALFSSPKGAGGGLIRVGSAIVTLAYGDVEALNVNGTAKIICLTGKAQVRSTKDLTERASLRPGNMIVIPAGSTEAPTVSLINLPALIESSNLLKMGPLPSQNQIEINARKQKGAPIAAPPGVNNEAITGAAMTTANITQQEALQAQQAARAAQEAAAAQQAVQAAQNAARIASARQLMFQQQAAAERAARDAQQAAAAQQAQRLAQQNQGNAFGPGGNPNNPNNGGGNPNNGQGNQGQGNGQGNQGQGQGNQ